MIRSLKALGLGLVAALALSAVVAASASAQPAHITAASNSGKIKLTQHGNTLAGIQRFETEEGMIECHKFSAEVNYANGANNSKVLTEATIENVKYEECFLGGLEADVKFNNCDYHLSGGEWVGTGHSTADVELRPQGCIVEIEDTITNCLVTVEGVQFFNNALTLTNVQTGTKEELTIHANATGIDYVAHNSCPAPGSFTDGVYEGTLTAKAFDTGGSQVHLTGIAT